MRDSKDACLYPLKKSPELHSDWTTMTVWEDCELIGIKIELLKKKIIKKNKLESSTQYRMRFLIDLDLGFSIGILLASEVRQFFMIWVPFLLYWSFNIPSPCPLNANNIFFSLVTTKCPLAGRSHPCLRITGSPVSTHSWSQDEINPTNHIPVTCCREERWMDTGKSAAAPPHSASLSLTAMSPMTKHISLFCAPMALC